MTLVSGPSSQKVKNAKVKRIDVLSAAEMAKACIENFPQTDGAIMAAAVADYTPLHRADKKVKREKDELHIELKATVDIAAALGKVKEANRITSYTVCYTKVLRYTIGMGNDFAKI